MKKKMENKNNKDKTISLRLNSYQFTMVKKLREKYKVNVSDFIRRQLELLYNSKQ